MKDSSRDKAFPAYGTAAHRVCVRIPETQATKSRLKSLRKTGFLCPDKAFPASGTAAHHACVRIPETQATKSRPKSLRKTGFLCPDKAFPAYGTAAHHVSVRIPETQATKSRPKSLRKTGFLCPDKAFPASGTAAHHMCVRIPETEATKSRPKSRFSSMKFLKSHVQILTCLIYEETFDNIAFETGLPLPALRNDIRDLLTQGMITGRVTGDHADATKLPRYDLDRLEQCSFKATRKGLQFWQTERHKHGL
jgi:hypothetical protein